MPQSQAFRTWAVLGISLAFIVAGMFAIGLVWVVSSPGAKWAVGTTSALLFVAAIVGARHRYPWLRDRQALEHPVQLALIVGVVFIVAASAVTVAALTA